MKDYCDVLPVSHQEVSEFIMKDLVRPLDVTRKELITQRDKLFNDVSVLNKELRRKTEQLMKAKQDYFKLYASQKEAQASMAKSKSDPMFSAKQLSKLAANISKLEKQTSDAHKQYQTNVASFQKFQATYESQMKTVLRSFQELDEKILTFIQTCLKLYLEKQYTVLQKIHRHDENLQALAERIDMQDVSRYIEQTTTGAKPEPLVEYQPYVSTVRPEKGASLSTQSSSSTMNPTGTTSLFGSRRTGSSAPVLGAVPFMRAGASASSDEASSDPGSSPADEERIEIPTSSDSPKPGSFIPKQSSFGSIVGRSGSSSDLRPSGSPTPSPSPAPAPLPPVNAAPAEQQASKARALFDYTAQDDTEIGFQTGDIITIISSHESGWWTGEINGRKGMFPAPYVSVITGETATPEPAVPAPAPAPIVAATPALEKRVCAFAFQATENNELSMQVGDVLEILATHGDWYLVQNAQGAQGLIPGNYTSPYP